MLGFGSFTVNVSTICSCACEEQQVIIINNHSFSHLLTHSPTHSINRASTVHCAPMLVHPVVAYASATKEGKGGGEERKSHYYFQTGLAINVNVTDETPLALTVPCASKL